MKKIHPDFQDEDFEEYEHDEDLEVLVYSSEEVEEEEFGSDRTIESHEEDRVDPRWKALQQIKSKK